MTEPSSRIPLPLSAALDVYVVEAVNHNFRDRLVIQQMPDRFEEVMNAGFKNITNIHANLLSQSGRQGNLIFGFNFD